MAVVAKSTGLAVALLLCVRVAVSQEPAGKDIARNGATPADAAASEQRETVKALQREVKALEGELGRLREQLTRVDRQLERLQNMQGQDSPSCDPPFSFDADGFKHYRKDCLDPQPESADDRCNPPYHLGEGGRKIFKVECL